MLLKSIKYDEKVKKVIFKEINSLKIQAKLVVVVHKAITRPSSLSHLLDLANNTNVAYNLELEI